MRSYLIQSVSAEKKNSLFKKTNLEVVFHFHNKFIFLWWALINEIKFIMEMEYYFLFFLFLNKNTYVITASCLRFASFFY